MGKLSILITTLIILVGFGVSDEQNVRLYPIQQPLDHFVFGGQSSNATFSQRVFVDYTFRDGHPNEDGMPVLVYLGGEADVRYWVGGGGIVTLAASRFRALVIYIEHRFYGQSVPLGSIDAAMMDPYVRGCLTSHQALADAASVIRRLKSDWSLQHSPVIAFGASYSGMLAAWFRIKYPHVVDGALASSAPVLDSEDIAPENEYCTIVSRDFKNINKKCHDTIAGSWKLIDEVAAQPDGLDQLSHIFSLCGPLFTATELKKYLAQVYNYAAQYNGRFGQIPQLCSIISEASEYNILKGIGDAILHYSEDESCNNITLMSSGSRYSILDRASMIAWDWQVCSELVPHQGCSESTMFERHPFNLSTFSEDCFDQYGEYPHSDWISTYYGGQNLKSSLKTSASNIIFSNGLLDPFSGASILEDVSKTVVAITTKQGSHCLDMNPPQDNDPKWLKHQREKELRIIGHWIETANSSSNQMSSLGVWLLLVSLYFIV
ncbi:uncharacterized protein LOC141632602 [Silene latifolia]|uniref:uncharacterized protein LOC141632602 n=1 Tax=Silene latifolia TaxID=37657 RepID=UPI003D77DB77